MHLDTGARAAMSGVAPAIQPVVSPTINGVAWTSATLTGTGVTPLFSWSPPAVGAPTSYRVEVTWHDWATGQPVLVAVLRVPPSVTSVRLPPGLMQTGRNYSAAVIAEQMPNSSFAARPFDTSFPTDWSRVGSGLMTP